MLVPGINLGSHWSSMVTFSPAQIIDICLTVGLSNMINRFHATFQTDVDSETRST